MLMLILAASTLYGIAATKALLNCFLNVLYFPNLQVQQYDRGMVIVGSSIGRAGGDAVTDAAAVDAESLLKQELEREKDREAHSHTAGAREALEEAETGHAAADGQKSTAKGVAVDRHFSYLAYDGTYGYERWRHDPASFHRDLATLEDETHSLESYRYRCLFIYPLFASMLISL